MKFRKKFLVLLSVFILLAGCTKAEESTTKDKEAKSDTKKELPIEDLLKEVNIAVIDIGDNSAFSGRDNWTIQQINQTEIIITSGLKAAGDFTGLYPGELLYNIWYGQDTLTTLSGAIKEATWNAFRMKGALEYLSQIKQLEKRRELIEKSGEYIAAFKEGEGKGKAIEDLILDPLSTYVANEELSYRTIKIMSYAFMSEEYKEEGSIPFGVWVGFINGTNIPISVERENNELIFYGRDVNKNSLYTRTNSTFQFYKEQDIRQFPNTRRPNFLDKKNNMGQVGDRIRKLTYDLYKILDGKEPIYFPDYAKALVASYEQEEKAVFENYNKALEELAGNVDPTNPILKLKWGMTLDEVNRLVPGVEELKQNGSPYLTVQENRYTSTSCVDADQVYFLFSQNKLDSISYALTINPKCNIDDLNAQKLVSGGFKELFSQVIQEYDPTSFVMDADYGTQQEWENDNTSFKLGFQVDLDHNPAVPYATYIIKKKKDGAPVVMVNRSYTTSTIDWSGEWAWENQKLTIDHQTPNSFDFRLNNIVGTAKFTSETSALYTDEKTGSKILFTLGPYEITVAGNDKCDCLKGMGVISFMQQ